VQAPREAAIKLRGKRVKVSYWIRSGGGAAMHGMTLRQFSSRDFLDGISYTGGADDPAVWNHFKAEGRLRNDFENLDIHISCPVPDSENVTAKSCFYIGDVPNQASEIAQPEFVLAPDPFNWPARRR
jgi:hypothetical protein